MHRSEFDFIVLINFDSVMESAFIVNIFIEYILHLHFKC